MTNDKDGFRVAIEYDDLLILYENDIAIHVSTFKHEADSLLAAHSLLQGFKQGVLWERRQVLDARKLETEKYNLYM